MNTKLGSEQVASVTARGAVVLRELAEENQELRSKLASAEQKVASFERRDQIRTLAQSMEDKGLNASMTFDEKVASIDTYPDLVQVENAIKMASSGSIGLPTVTEDLHGRGSSAVDSFHLHLRSGGGE